MSLNYGKLLTQLRKNEEMNLYLMYGNTK